MVTISSRPIRSDSAPIFVFGDFQRPRLPILSSAGLYSVRADKIDVSVFVVNKVLVQLEDAQTSTAKHPALRELFWCRKTV